MKKVGAVIGCVVAAAALGACGETTSSGDAAGQGKMSVSEDSTAEAKLASIDSGSSLVDEIDVNRYGLLLDRLAKRCREERGLISDFTVRSVELLAERGIDSSNLEQLQAANDALPGSAKRMRCRAIFATLVTLQSG